MSYHVFSFHSSCVREMHGIFAVSISIVCHVFLSWIFRKTKKWQNGLNSWHLRVIRCSGERAENQLLGVACTSCATCMVVCTKLLDKPRAKSWVLFQCTCVDHAQGCLEVFVKNCKSPKSPNSGYLHWWWIRRPNSWVSRSHCLCHG